MTIALRRTDCPAPILPRPGVTDRPDRAEAAQAATHPALWRWLIDPKARRIARYLASMPPHLRRDIGLPD